MKPVPWWKIKRELRRLFKQFIWFRATAWEYLTLTFRYDTFMSKARKLHKGEISLSSEVAIFLIYPKDGVLSSHLQMLDMLRSNHIAPVVISNSPLSVNDLEVLKTKCALIVERPNVGYDFGGYRDGVLELAAALPNIERLYILNDSVWMVESPRSWFEDVKDRGTEFCGATSNYGIRRYSDAEFREIRWEYTPAHRNFHYASYALAFGGKILRDPDFLRFWKRFRLSNSKTRTVRRGEIGLSQWVIKKGYSHAATCDVHDLDLELQSLDTDDLEKVTRHLVLPEAPFVVKKRNEILKSDPSTEQGRSDRINIILTAVSTQAIGYVMPYYTIGFRGFQFIKKSPLWLSSDSSSITLKILEGLEGTMGRQAFSEAQRIVKDRGVGETIMGEGTR